MYFKLAGTTLPQTQQVRYGMGDSIDGGLAGNRLGSGDEIYLWFHKVVAQCADYRDDGDKHVPAGTGGPHDPCGNRLRSLDGDWCPGDCGAERLSVW